MFHFFAYVSKLKYITRWGLKRNTRTENVQEHSHEVAVIAHGLATIRNLHFDGTVNADRIAVIALFHDASEVLTGDLPAPIKYFNPKIKDAYQAIERVAEEKLLDMLPQPLKDHYASLLIYSDVSKEEKAIIKAADLISAYIKCLEEVQASNTEFQVAKERVKNMLWEIDLPEVRFFMEHFLPSYSLTLDELE